MLPTPAAPEPVHLTRCDDDGRGSARVGDVVVAGEIDVSNCDQIASGVDRRCVEGCTRIRIDLGAVTFIDAAAIGTLITARDRARAAGCEVVVVAVHGLPLRMLQMLCLDTVLVEGAVPAEADDPPDAQRGR
jgi:anti-anti-sigma factor